VTISATAGVNGPRRLVGFFSGDPQPTSVKVVLASFFDADITVNVYSNAARTTLVTTVTIYSSAGASPKLAKYCDDRADSISDPLQSDPSGVNHLCWVGSTTITGLAANTRYFLKLTQVQGASTVVEMDASTCTAPATGTDFSVYFANCDSAHAFSYVVGGGGWKTIAQDIKRGYTECKYLVWADDIGYTDWLRTSDTSGGEDTVTGKALTPNGAGGFSKPIFDPIAYNYGYLYLVLLGMMGQNATSELAWGADRNRMFCMRNMPIAWQWGDHEFNNDCGHWSGALYVGGSGTTPGSAAAQATPWYAPGKTAWDTLIGLANPTPTIKSVDTTANHWAWSLGDLLILCPDSITNGSGCPLMDGVPILADTLLGVGQITDLLNAANTAHPFKCFVLPTFDFQSWETVTDDSLGHGNGACGTHIPLQECSPSDYDQLVWSVGATPKSLMDNPKTNGTEGVLVLMHGDIHRSSVDQYHGNKTRTGMTGLVGSWVNVHYGCTGGQANVTVAESVFDLWQDPAGDDGLLCLWYPSLQKLWPDGETSPEQTDRWPSYGRIDVSGSLPTKEINVRLFQRSDSENAHVPEVWAGTFRVGSNLPVP
jgi:hypothetical protein